MPELTPQANRAARGILNWSIQDLANRAGVAASAVENFEMTGIATDLVKQDIAAAFAAENVVIIDVGGTGAMILRPARSASHQTGSPLADEPTALWSPIRDARGRLIPLTYDFVFTDERDTVIGQWREEDEPAPVSQEWLKREATELARKITRAHPSERPWDGWRVTIVATGLSSEPVDVASLDIQDLLNT